MVLYKGNTTNCTDEESIEGVVVVFGHTLAREWNTERGREIPHHHTVMILSRGIEREREIILQITTIARTTMISVWRTIQLAISAVGVSEHFQVLSVLK